MTIPNIHQFLLPFLLLIFPFALAVSASPAASTLYLSERNTIFALNIPTNSSDLYFHFSAPAKSWVAVGIGEHMKGALYFFMYGNARMNDVVLSPRISNGTYEPSFAPEISISKLEGTGIIDGMYIVNAICHNCRTWNGGQGKLDVNSENQSWMYAFGGSNPQNSDSVAADLVQHAVYGKFTINLPHATGPPGIPASTTISNGTTLIGMQYIRSGDTLSLVHGYTMSALLLVFTPLLALHLLSHLKWPWILHTVFTLVAILGLSMGFYDSMNYNRSRGFGTPHQIIGIAALGGMIVLVIVRCMGRTKDVMSDEAKKRVFRWFYIGLGSLVWVLAMLDGFLGIKLGLSRNLIFIIYGICVIASILISAPLFWWVERSTRTKRREHKSKVQVHENTFERGGSPAVACGAEAWQ